jgi:two-component system, OmpR family, sensor histidine kinase TctE
MFGSRRNAAVRPSIRRALAAWLLLPLALLVPLSAALLYRLTIAPALDTLDHALGGTALGIAGLVRGGPDRLHVSLSPDTESVLRADRFDQVYFTVLDPAGRAIAGDADLADAAIVVKAGEWRFDDLLFRGQRVRLAVLGTDCGMPPSPCQVRVAESLVKRGEAQSAVLFGSCVAMGGMALALALLGSWAIARAIRPVEHLSTDIERYSLDNLRPVSRPDIPAEIAPLIDALNRLFDRVRLSSEQQQAFLADAAHQLRTPLTALRTESELALLEPHPPQFEATLRRLNQGAARAARLAHQLLSQARTDDEAKRAQHEPVDLKRIASDAAQEWVAQAVERGADLGFELAPAPTLGVAYLLQELLANLLHNALAYAGEAAQITVRTRVDEAAREALLEVEDDGPGIPPDERSRVFERFQRGAAGEEAGSGGTGSGLGLSIVRDIARHHDAKVQLHGGAGGRGLLVRVRFPLLPAALQAAAARTS